MGIFTKRGSAAAVAVLGILAAGCTTELTQQADLWDSQVVPQTPQQKWEQLDDMSRIELAAISRSVYVASPRVQAVNSARSPYFSTVADHEKSVRASEDKTVRKTRNLRFATYDAETYQSINDEVPPGFEQVNIGYQHVKSGMICPFGLATEDDTYAIAITNIRLFDQQSTDVGCDYKTTTGGYITIFSSYWPDITQAQHAAAANQQIRDRFKTDKALDVVIVTLEDYNAATMGTATASGYDISEAGAEKPIKSSVWVAKTRQWHVKARATHYMDDPLTELFAAMMHNRTHVDVFNTGGRVLGEIDV
ncbi:MAG: hypothetical protein AAGK25_12650 [Pseudomonadota bacterium]